MPMATRFGRVLGPVVAAAVVVLVVVVAARELAEHETRDNNATMSSDFGVRRIGERMVA
jgi:hypothetical protein